MKSYGVIGLAYVYALKTYGFLWVVAGVTRHHPQKSARDGALTSVLYVFNFDISLDFC
jgi:hypothetical protein